MNLRPALAGAAIVALLLTGCTSTPEPKPSPKLTASSTPKAAPTPTLTPEPTVTAEPAPTTAPDAGSTSAAVTSIVLHPTTIDFLAADGTKVDSVAMNESADQAAKAITYVLKTSPTVETMDLGFCGMPSEISTWPGGLAITERPGGGSWWDHSEYMVTLSSSGKDGVSFETAGGYKVGDTIKDGAGVPGTFGSTENASPELNYQWFATELENPKAAEHERWGVIASGFNQVIDRVTVPQYLQSDC